MDIALLLNSVWLLPVMALLVALDGPFPVLPSEPLLMTASAVAIGAHDVPMALGLLAAAFAGSVAGDHLLFALGRTSRRIAGPGRGGIAGWVQRNIALRPSVTIVGARFVPAGRLVSTTAAGRYGLSPRRFLPCSLASSALWAGYMMAVGLLLGPLTGGDPLRGLVAGIAMGALTAGAFALVERLRARRPASALCMHLGRTVEGGRSGTPPCTSWCPPGDAEMGPDDRLRPGGMGHRGHDPRLTDREPDPRHRHRGGPAGWDVRSRRRQPAHRAGRRRAAEGRHDQPAHAGARHRDRSGRRHAAVRASSRKGPRTRGSPSCAATPRPPGNCTAPRPRTASPSSSSGGASRRERS